MVERLICVTDRRVNAIETDDCGVVEGPVLVTRRKVRDPLLRVRKSTSLIPTLLPNFLVSRNKMIDNIRRRAVAGPKYYPQAW